MKHVFQKVHTALSRLSDWYLEILVSLDQVNDKNSELILTEERQLGHIRTACALIDEFYTYLEIDRAMPQWP